MKKTIQEIQRIVEVPQDGIFGPITARAVLGRLNGEEPFLWPDEFDERTRGNLHTLAIGAARRFEPFLLQAFAIAASMGVEAKVICGLRNERDQAKAKASGASKAGWGYSWHNYGIAIDLGLFKGRRYVDSTEPGLAWTVYSAIGEIAPRHGIEWGGSWTSFVDAPHFHLAGLGSTPSAEDRRRLKAGTWRL